MFDVTFLSRVQILCSTYIPVRESVCIKPCQLPCVYFIQSMSIVLYVNQIAIHAYTVTNSYTLEVKLIHAPFDN